MGNWLKMRNCSWEWPAKFALSQDSISQDKIAKSGISLPSPLAVCSGATGLMNFESLHILIAGSVRSWKSSPQSCLETYSNQKFEELEYGMSFPKLQVLTLWGIQSECVGAVAAKTGSGTARVGVTLTRAEVSSCIIILLGMVEA